MNTLTKFFNITLALIMLLFGLINTANSATTISPTTQTVTGTVGTAIFNTAAIVVTGFTGTVTYTISPFLSAGLTLDPSTGVISGTPSVAKTATKYTITAKGTTGTPRTTIVNITIKNPPALSPATQTINGYVGSSIAATKSLTASNFSGAVTYSVDPLPGGLSLNAATGQITGIPTTPQTASNYTITGIDAAGGTAKTVVTIAVSTPTIAPATQSISGVIGTAITATSSMVGTGFSGAISYAITPPIPAGLSFSTSRGIISGKPTAPSLLNNYIITATNATGATANAQVTIVVVPPPPSITPATQTVTGKINTAIRATQGYTANYFSGAVTYTIDQPLSNGQLSNGLLFNSTTGAISGTPTAIQSPLPATYTITATGPGNESATATVAVTISPDVTPSSQTIKWPVNAPIHPTTPFTPIGFAGSVSYTVSPALPNGLVIDSSTGIISGTSTVSQAASNYVVTVTDNISGSAKASVSIAITNPPNCLPPTMTTVQEGRRAYLRLNCYSCHGDTGLGGMGPNIQGEGGGVNDAVPNGAEGGMPPFDNYLCANDLTYLQAYLNSLGGRSGSTATFKHWWDQNPTK